MPVFAIVLDAAGVEVQKARSSGTSLFFGITHLKMTAIRSVSMEHSPSGTMKGAAWGLWLAGPLGAAVGSMIGGEARVAFEVDVEGGNTLNCVGTKGEYLAAKREFTNARLTAQQRASRQAEWARRGRRPSFFLLVGMVLLPIAFVWFFLRKDYRWLTRGVAAAWTVVWAVFFFTAPPAPPPENHPQRAGRDVLADVLNGSSEDALPNVITEEEEPPNTSDADTGVSSESRDMTFEACLDAIEDMSRQTGVRPVSIINTNIMRTVRFPTNDGSVLITCSGPDQRMIVTRSPHR